jgi:hypothetical protein
LRELVIRVPNARVCAGACTAHKCVWVCARRIYVYVPASCADTLACAETLLHKRTRQGASSRLRPLGRDWGYPAMCAKTASLAGCAAPWPRALAHARARARGTHSCMRSRNPERQTPMARDVQGATRGAQRSRQCTCALGARHTDRAQPSTCKRTRAHLLPVWACARLACHRSGTRSKTQQTPPLPPLPTLPLPREHAVPREVC